MLETFIIALVITGGAVAFANQWQRKQPTTQIELAQQPHVLSAIAQGGLYSFSKPSEKPQVTSFSNLHLAHEGMVWRDNRAGTQHIVDFRYIQWVSAVDFQEEGIAKLEIHLDIGGHWRILSLQLPASDMGMLVKILKRVLPAHLTNLGQAPAKPIGPLSAKLTEDTLQGETSLGAEVSLYLLPHLLIVLADDTVQAKLDMSSVRRVLAVERITGAFDNILSKQPDGVIRLYSMYETASFALPQYRELAQEISYLSRCPVEFITQDEKTGKM